jgi:hypothetical protein
MHELILRNQYSEIIETRLFRSLAEVYAWVAQWDPETKLADPLLDGVALSPQACRRAQFILPGG